MDLDQAKAVLEKVEYWHYPFDLPWGRTSPHKPGHDSRHFLRRNHFFQPLLEICGGSLKGRNVLDLGCCQGCWTFESVKAGAAWTVGMDSSAAFIQEAKALQAVLGFEKCSFFKSHMEDDRWWEKLQGEFDVTLFLGLFYHLTDPVFVLRKAMDLTHEIIIVDTEVMPGEQPLLSLRPRDPNELTTWK